ncbi:hypothetical protein [Acinetobacter sp. 226]|uniref:hypothetical protein n=1 Tax=Acinetobacter sp. 226 TaxID=3114699 RepID=UPI003A88B779
MKIKEGGVMDVQEKKAFEIAFDNKLGARGCQFDLDEDGNYEDRETLCGWHMWLEAKAQAVPEGFVLIKDDTKTVVAIERMVEQQVEASGMDSRRLERLDGWKIIEAAVKAQEPAK